MKFLKSNIFVFFVLGAIFMIIDWKITNWDNYHGEGSERYWRLYMEIILYIYLPFILAIILHSVIKFSKSEKVQKVAKIVMKITNVLSVLYLLFLAFAYCAVIALFEG